MVGTVTVLHAVVNMNRGGAETLLMNLYRNIDRSKVRFDFLTSKPGIFDEEIKQLGGYIHRIPYISDVGHFQYVKMLNRFFAEHKEYRVIHSHMDKMSGLVLRAAARTGVPVRIAHSHNTMSEGGLAVRAYKWLAGKSISSLATNYLACSRTASEWMFPGKESEVQIIKNGIEGVRFAFDPGKRANVRSELGIGENTFVIGHVGRFLPQKNHAYLIERFAEFKLIHGNCKLLLAGDGPLRTEMETFADKLKVKDDMCFLGIRDDVDSLLQCFDVIVFPSLHEGLPLTLIEAQRAGLTCIISDTITTEVDLGFGLIQSFSLREPKRCLKMIRDASQHQKSRTIYSDDFTRTGYEISGTARWLQDFYLSQL
ncbi:glycosyltransferase family 1 protein [Paenibacillus humicola]|uniref:glycosyltransferase family 1 protein n=1 Tax=Paenibacillus humicola TaxID=3110540 RepID=UPI00237ADCFC|nr:glycosyltransferase family 1 protein [Paenibacillus humicola]